jgi:hypothetical protein
MNQCILKSLAEMSPIGEEIACENVAQNSELGINIASGNVRENEEIPHKSTSEKART